jgi:hypothetical protein
MVRAARRQSRLVRALLRQKGKDMKKIGCLALALAFAFAGLARAEQPNASATGNPVKKNAEKKNNQKKNKANSKTNDNLKKNKANSKTNDNPKKNKKNQPKNSTAAKDNQGNKSGPVKKVVIVVRVVRVPAPVSTPAVILPGPCPVVCGPFLPPVCMPGPVMPTFMNW